MNYVMKSIIKKFPSRRILRGENPITMIAIRNFVNILQFRHNLIHSWSKCRKLFRMIINNYDQFTENFSSFDSLSLFVQSSHPRMNVQIIQIVQRRTSFLRVCGRQGIPRRDPFQSMSRQPGWGQWKD